jgi:hypothetical protein
MPSENSKDNGSRGRDLRSDKFKQRGFDRQPKGTEGIE